MSELILYGNDPDTKARNATTAGKITQRVKDESEREKAIIMTKASIHSWFHNSLEDYIHSRANPARQTDWDNNNWPEIMKHIRSWFLEPVSQNDGELTSEEQDRLLRDYRMTRQGTSQTLSEWETVFKRLVTLVNERANANKSDLEQAKDFIDKIFAMVPGSMNATWRKTGCVESAKLWYNHISKTIKDFGFEVNPFDQCVFQKKDGEK